MSPLRNRDGISSLYCSLIRVCIKYRLSFVKHLLSIIVLETELTNCRQGNSWKGSAVRHMSLKAHYIGPSGSCSTSGVVRGKIGTDHLLGDRDSPEPDVMSPPCLTRQRTGAAYEGRARISAAVCNLHVLFKSRSLNR